MKDQMQEIAESYLNATECALSGSLTLNQLHTYWRIEADREALLWKLMSETEHFITDKDIHGKDVSYERYQRELLASLMTDVVQKYGVKP